MIFRIAIFIQEMKLIIKSFDVFKKKLVYLVTVFSVQFTYIVYILLQKRNPTLIFMYAHWHT